MDDWSEIEYLTEKDLPYFRKKAEKGEAVILEIPLEILRSMDIKSLLEDECICFPTPCREAKV